MGKQVINIGTITNDGTGSPLRVAMDMVNDNFTELYNAETLNTAKVTNANHTGDITGSTILTLATVNADVGSFTNANITVNAKGLVTSASNGTGGGGGSMVYPSVGIALSSGSAWGTSITNNSTNWNTAYGWGNHASAGYVTGTPWTVMGYVTGTPWTAMGYVTGTPWTAMGYLTSQTSHADVVVDGDFTSNGLLKRTAAGVYSIVTDASSNWNTAYGWGNHVSLYVPIADKVTKYSSTINLSAGVVTQKTTTVTTEPYSILLLDASDNVITDSVIISLTIAGGFYVLNIYSADAITGVKLKILY
jgi:hypothetical protein